MGLKSTLLNAYDKHYKKLLLVSFFVLFIAIGILFYNKLATGEFVQKGVSLKGGLTITIPTQKDVNVVKLQSALSQKFPKADISVRKATEAGSIKAIIIEASDTEAEQIVAALKDTGFNLEKENYSIESMGSSLGTRFFKQTITAVILAFLGMSLVVFITFRTLLPSLFVILCAVSDIICTMAVVSLLGTRLSTAGIAAFLMLIGYSVDTDILLTTRVLKRKEGTVFERTIDAMKTGMTMSLTTFAVALIALVLAQSDTIKQIMLIILVGMLFDLLFTWVQNAGILRWHLERKTMQAQQQGVQK